MRTPSKGRLAGALLLATALAASAAVFGPLSIAAAPSGATSFDLYAGKTTDVGNVKVWNGPTSLYVEIDLTGSWCMTESHVAAAVTLDGIPQVNGNPVPGQFPYGDTYAPCATTDTFAIPLAGLGSDPFVAVHAKVLHQTSMWVYSDGDGKTMVTASTAPLGAFPYAAVDAWEAFGDPADPTPSVWDSGVGVGTFTHADWIWQSYRVQTPTVDETVTFQRTFMVPGPVAPGSWMKVTTDDAFTASLNGSPVASGTWPNWTSVQTASPFAPVQGSNTLVFVATNSSQSYGAAGTIDNNPGGLIYEAKVKYYDRSESAWAGTGVGTLAFPGKNWATYVQVHVYLETATLYDVTATPTAWSCTDGVTNLTGATRGTVAWSLVGDVVTVKVAVTGGLPGAGYDIWVEQNPGTCPPGTSTPSNPNALTTDATGAGTLTFSFAHVAGATNYWLTLWSPVGPPYPGPGASVIRSTAISF